MNKYNIPVGSLVEVRVKGVEADKKHHGMRLYVSLHRKDSEGISVYSLGVKGETNTIKMFHGFYENDLVVIDKISVQLTREEINDIIQWGNTCEEEGWLIEREKDLKVRLTNV